MKAMAIPLYMVLQRMAMPFTGRLRAPVYWLSAAGKRVIMGLQVGRVAVLPQGSVAAF